VYKRQIYQTAQSNRKKSIRWRQSNRNFSVPKWNALVQSLSNVSAVCDSLLPYFLPSDVAAGGHDTGSEFVDKASRLKLYLKEFIVAVQQLYKMVIVLSKINA